MQKKRANYKCAICGRPVKRLEAHEQWSYDEEKGVQKLENIIAVCHDCHSVIHIGRTQLVGDIERAEKHYMKVNGVSYVEYIKDLGKANEDHQYMLRKYHEALDALNEFKNKDWN